MTDLPEYTVDGKRIVPFDLGEAIEDPSRVCDVFGLRPHDIFVRAGELYIQWVGKDHPLYFNRYSVHGKDAALRLIAKE